MRYRLVVTMAFLGCFCTGEKPPRLMGIGGENMVQPKDTFWFWARAIDPNGDNISYLFNFGDGSEPQWSAELVSGETMFCWHCYEDTGGFNLKVKARDERGQESDFSEPFLVTVQFFGPLIPERPQGARFAYPDTPLVFSTRVEHLRSESVAVQFDFGEGLSDWIGFFPAGSQVAGMHTYQSRGVYAVKARARDKSGNVSPWSEPESVLIGFPPFSAPANLRISAFQGILVRLRWDKGRTHDSVKYAVWFRQVDSSGFRLVDTVFGMSYIHDPVYTTGYYTVSARFREIELFASETLATVAVFTDTLVLAELNATGFSGYAWDSVSGQGFLVSMHDTGSARVCRFYLTDFEPDSSGHRYFIASPHLAPFDSGGVAPEGNWERTYLLNFTGNIRTPLPDFDSTVYRDRVELGQERTDIALYSAGANYALISVFPANGARVKVVSWVQMVKNLRLIYPSEEKGRWVRN